ncbi:MAG TPA: hypothetical protein VFQ35_08895 [Polyangiaceae bacterium]|nr:hypothetical protein [Polyangiaceae bacterium]
MVAATAFWAFRAITKTPRTTRFLCSTCLWAALTLLAYAMWQLGPRTSLGRSLVGLVVPLLTLPAALNGRKRWRASLAATLSFCIPACTLRLFVDFLYVGTAHTSGDPVERLCVLLEAVAEFLRENAVTTAIGVLTLFCCFRPNWAPRDRRAFVSATIVFLLATLSVTVTCGGALLVLDGMMLHRNR